MDKNIHYLCHTYRSNERFMLFEASFTEFCKIHSCFIMASSVKDALSVLYSELSDIYDVDYLDSHLLSVKFKSCSLLYD